MLIRDYFHRDFSRLCVKVVICVFALGALIASMELLRSLDGLALSLRSLAWLIVLELVIQTDILLLFCSALCVSLILRKWQSEGQLLALTCCGKSALWLLRSLSPWLLWFFVAILATQYLFAPLAQRSLVQQLSHLKQHRLVIPSADFVSLKDAQLTLFSQSQQEGVSLDVFIHHKPDEDWHSLIMAKTLAFQNSPTGAKTWRLQDGTVWFYSPYQHSRSLLLKFEELLFSRDQAQSRAKLQSSEEKPQRSYVLQSQATAAGVWLLALLHLLLYGPYHRAQSSPLLWSLGLILLYIYSPSLLFQLLGTAGYWFFWWLAFLALLWRGHAGRIFTRRT